MIDPRATIADHHEAKLLRLKAAMDRLMAIHADMAWLNDTNAEYRKAEEEFMIATRAMWKFKQAVYG